MVVYLGGLDQLLIADGSKVGDLEIGCPEYADADYQEAHREGKLDQSPDDSFCSFRHSTHVVHMV